MSTEAGDMEVRKCVRNHSEQAFRTLVERHVDLVYRLALPQTRNALSDRLSSEVRQEVNSVHSQWNRR